MREQDFSVDYLRSQFRHDPAAGKLYWTVNKRGPVRAGDEVGVTNHGYRQTKLDQTVLMVHRIIWALHFGYWPTGDIDHIDGDPSNNKIENLRDVTRAVNMQNRHAPKRNSVSGFLGVHRCAKDLKKPWVAKIVVDGVGKHLGYHESPELAYAAYLSAKRQCHEGCTI